MPAVKVFWYDGFFGSTGSVAHAEAANLKQFRPPIVAELEKKYGRDLKTGGTIYVGTKGIMHTGNYGGSPRIIPEEKMKDFGRPPKKLARVAKPKPGLGAHQNDFLRACKDGKPACSDFSYGGRLSEVVLLGCLAEKVGPGKKVQWDPETLKCAGMPELDPLINRQYRKGWEL
jgi:hypothetical protein